jgi:hypothetical protein
MGEGLVTGERVSLELHRPILRLVRDLAIRESGSKGRRMEARFSFLIL